MTILGLGQEDKSGKLTKTINVGDIIEPVGPDGSDTRFKVTDATGADLMAVEFASGDQGFVLDQQYTITSTRRIKQLQVKTMSMRRTR